MFRSYLFSPMRFFIYFFTLSFVVLIFGQKTQPPESGKSFHALRYGKGKVPYPGVKTVLHDSDVSLKKLKIIKPTPKILLPGVRRLIPQEYPTIQAAIDACVDGDTVLISEGMYFENIRYKGKAIVVASHYLIDGDTTHIPQTIIDGSNPSHPDSGSVVYFINGEDTTSVLSGLTIRGGTGTNTGRWSGGTWWVGGGIVCLESGAKLVRNIITKNHVRGPIVKGGGIAIWRRSATAGHAVMIDNRIIANVAQADSADGYGGGVGVARINLRFSGNLVERDTVTSLSYAEGGGMEFRGCHTLFPSPRAVAVFEGNIFRENICISNQIAIAGGLNLTWTGPCTLNSNIVEGNKTLSGPGFWAGGGGLFINDGDIPGGFPNWKILHNNILKGNLVTVDGGGLFAGGARVVMMNNTISRNTALTAGGGLFFGGDNSEIMMNNIIWNNLGTGQISQQSSSSGHYFHNNIQGGWPGTGNMNIDPQFADTLFHLLPNSYCVGMGRSSIALGDSIYQAPLFDLEGNPRPNPIDTLVDIGAYETPYPGRAQLVKSIINKGISYIHPTQDSLRMLLQVLDFHQQGVTLAASIRNLQGAVWDEFPLYDDGQHGDSLAGDNYFGAILPPVMLDDAFRFNYCLFNNSFQDTMLYEEEQQVTSIGPLVCEDYHILSQVSNRIQLELVLRNLGQHSTASEVRAELIPQDSAVIGVISNNRSFGDIPAGGTAVNSSAYIIDIIENPGTISFDVRISMGGYPYWLQENLVVGIEPGSSQQLPGEFALYQNYPNPFNASTVITWQLAVGSRVRLSLYNISGQEVAVLINNEQPAGHHQIRFDASGMASGVYFYRLSSKSLTGRAQNFVESGKMLLLK